MSARGLILDYFSIVKYLALFTIARLLFEPRYFFDEFFWYDRVFEMKMNNFLVGDFFIANFMLVVSSLQSENNSFL